MKNALALCASALIMTGCGGGGGGGDNNSSTIGHLTHTGIRGLTYQTASQSGVTDENGTFYYYPGETISFSIGPFVLAKDIVAKQFLSTLDFDPAQKSILDTGTVVNGLTTHTEAESQSVKTNWISNVSSFLYTLDRDSDPTNGIFISDSIVEQLNDAKIEEPIDFNKSNFGPPKDVTAPENRLIWSLCFENQTPETCSDPTGGRTIQTSASTQRSLIAELNKISLDLAQDISLDPYTIKMPASDTDVHEVHIVQHTGNRDIAALEVISTDETVLRVQGSDKFSRTFDFYSVGQTGDQAEIIANMKFTGDYRWFQVNLRVILQ